MDERAHGRTITNRATPRDRAHALLGTFRRAGALLVMGRRWTLGLLGLLALGCRGDQGAASAGEGGDSTGASMDEG